MIEHFMAMNWATLLTGAGALGAVLAKVFGVFSQRRKDKADTRRDTVTDRDALLDRYFKDAELLTKRLDSLEKWKAEAEEEIKKMGERNSALSLENAELRRENGALKAENARLQGMGQSITVQAPITIEAPAPPG